MKRSNLIIVLLLFSCKLQAQVDILKQVINNFGSVQNITYTSIEKRQEFFGENILCDTNYVQVFLDAQKLNAFLIQGRKGGEIFYGDKLLRLTIRDSTYRISRGVKKSYYATTMFPALITRLKNNVQKHVPIKLLGDSVVAGKKLLRIKITELDSVKNNKHIFRYVTLLVDKSKRQIYGYREDQHGFIDGTDIFIEHFEEFTFSGLSFNKPNFPDLALTQLPAFYKLEKPSLAIPMLNSGTKAPELELFDRDGNIFSLAAQKGKVVLLNFTIVGCPHCVESIGMLNNLHGKYPASQFLIVTINPIDDMPTIEKNNSRFDVRYPVYRNRGEAKKNVESYHVSAYPAFYLIDKNGTIAQSFKGYYPELSEELPLLIDRLNTI